MFRGQVGDINELHRCLSRLLPQGNRGPSSHSRDFILAGDGSCPKSQKAFNPQGLGVDRLLNRFPREEIKISYDLGNRRFKVFYQLFTSRKKRTNFGLFILIKDVRAGRASSEEVLHGDRLERLSWCTSRWETIRMKSTRTRDFDFNYETFKSPKRERVHRTPRILPTLTVRSSLLVWRPCKRFRATLSWRISAIAEASRRRPWILDSKSRSVLSVPFSELAIVSSTFHGCEIYEHHIHDQSEID